MPRVAARKAHDEQTLSSLQSAEGAFEMTSNAMAISTAECDLLRDAAGRALPFEQAAVVVLGGLQHAVLDLLNATREDIRRATDVKRIFGVDYNLSWQVHRIAQSENPLSAGLNVPARVSMKKFLTAAARRRIGVSPAGASTLDRVSAAFDRFEAFVRHYADDRTELESMLRNLLPEEREKRDVEGRQELFRAVCKFKGALLEAETSSNFYFPSADGERLDKVRLMADWGLRRLRPGSRIGFTTANMTAPATTPLALNGQLPSEPMSMLLPEFCSNPLPKLDVATTDGLTHYTVAGSDVGLQSAVDLVMAEYRPGALRRYRSGESSRIGSFYAADPPSKRTTMDFFIHKDVFQDVAPKLAVYDIIPQGCVVKFGDAARERDRIEVTETIRSLGTGFAAAGLPHVRRYTEMLEHLLRRIGHDPRDYRGFRLDLHYPICGAQYVVAFDLPKL